MLLPVVVVYRKLVIKEHYLMVVAWHLATSVFCEGKGGQCDVSVQGVRVVGAIRASVWGKRKGRQCGVSVKGVSVG